VLRFTPRWCFREASPANSCQAGQLFSLDDAKTTISSSWGPLRKTYLLELPNTEEFTFKQITSGPRIGTMEIINSHPGSGDPKSFFRLRRMTA